MKKTLCRLVLGLLGMTVGLTGGCTIPERDNQHSLFSGRPRVEAANTTNPSIKRNFCISIKDGSYYKQVPSETVDPSEIQDTIPIVDGGRDKDEKDLERMSYEEAMKYVQTPEQVKDYIKSVLNKRRAKIIQDLTVTNDLKSFKTIHKGIEYASCIEATVAAAALLKDNGYQPLVLMFLKKGYENIDPTKEFSGHAVYIFKKDGKFGSRGIEDLKDNKEPKFDIVLDLARSISRDGKIVYSYHYFYILDLDKVEDVDKADHSKINWVERDFYIPSACGRK